MEILSAKFVTLMNGVQMLVNGDILHQSVRQIFYIASLNAKMMSGSDYAYFAWFLSFLSGYMQAIFYPLNSFFELFRSCGGGAFVAQSAVVDQHLQSYQTIVTYQVLYILLLSLYSSDGGMEWITYNWK